MFNYKQFFYLFLVLFGAHSNSRMYAMKEAHTPKKSMCYFHLRQRPLGTDCIHCIPRDLIKKTIQAFPLEQDKSLLKMSLTSKISIKKTIDGNDFIFDLAKDLDHQTAAVAAAYWSSSVQKMFLDGNLEVLIDTINLKSPNSVQGVLHLYPLSENIRRAAFRIEIDTQTGIFKPITIKGEPTNTTLLLLIPQNSKFYAWFELVHSKEYQYALPSDALFANKVLGAIRLFVPETGTSDSLSPGEDKDYTL